jgi:hypothetical protein
MGVGWGLVKVCMACACVLRGWLGEPPVPMRGLVVREGFGALGKGDGHSLSGVGSLSDRVVSYVGSILPGEMGLKWGAFWGGAILCAGRSLTLVGALQ